MKKYIRKLIQRFAVTVGVQIQKYQHAIARESLPNFGNDPENLLIELPRRIINPERIYLGNNVSLGPGSFLIAMTHYPPKAMQGVDAPAVLQTFDSKIMIGHRVTATADLQVAAQNKIVIEDDVMFASNVHVNDGFHGYADANVPFKDQQLSNISPILIKKGCWIGQNVIVLPGVTIGSFSIVGANSVVSKSIPDQCIAVGNPARVIKKWDKTNKWLQE